jgi:hypothetical protein
LDWIVGVNVGRSEAEGIGMEFVSEIVIELMRIRRNKLPFFGRGMRDGYVIDSIYVLTALSPREG